MELIPWEDRKNIFYDRYALKSHGGVLLENTPEEMWLRVAKATSDNQQEQNMFYGILENFQFVPSGRILAGDRTLYNCFVIGFGLGKDGADSRRAIMLTVENMVEITARGGGVGINWSPLRPRNTYIKGVKGDSSGSVAWMRGADAFADAIRQAGSRTAALMFMLDDWHPDVIELTRTGSRFERANFSINISSQFMQAVEKDEVWELVFPDTTSPFYDSEWDGDLENWKSKQLPVVLHNTIRAKDLWRAMAESAHMIGSPGVAFLDRCNQWSNTRHLHNLVCFNPCGEQPLPKNGSCNLGAMNLLAFVDADRKFMYNKLGMVIRHAIRFLDRIIDVSEDINQDIGDLQRIVRRVGLGTMGLADVMILLGIQYGSEKSIKFIHELYPFIRNTAYFASMNLANEKGPAPGYDAENVLDSPFIATLPDILQKQISTYGLRNLALLTQAPTGTTSILAGASSGIEPIFSREYSRTDNTGCSAIKHPLADDPNMITSKEIHAEDHIRVQAAIQTYLDASISKTINMPEDCSIEEIMKAYKLAHELDCRGITIYRANSLDDVLCETCEL